MNKKITPQLIIWFLGVMVFLSLFSIMAVQGLPLNTNIMDLLPSQNIDSAFATASQTFSKRMGNQLIFLIAHPNLQKAEQANDLFVDSLNKSGQFTTIKSKVPENEQEAWASFYFPYRQSLLSDESKKILKNKEANKLIQTAIYNLYNPMSLANSGLLENDPFFLFQDYIFSLPKPASHVDLDHNYMTVKTLNMNYTVINASIKNDSFSLKNQDKILSAISLAEKEVKKKYIGTSVLKTGLLFYAKAGDEQAEHDISTIGIGSIIGIIILLLATFRSLSPLVFTLFSSAIGFICAFVITCYVFGSVYLFTLVFGASLIGISVDYAFFYYADRLFGGLQWQANEGLKRIFPGITLGLVNVFLSFIIIAFAPFPGLRQLAVFALVGLGGAYATVVCFYPFILKIQKKETESIITCFSNFYLKFWEAISIRKISLIYVLIILFIVSGISQLHTNDDIRILETPPLQLKQDEQTIKAIIGSHIGQNYILVKGATPEETLQHEEVVLNTIHKTFPLLSHPYISVADYLPDIKTQKENYDLIQSQLIQSNLIPYLTGVSKAKAQATKENLSKSSYKPLTTKDWLNSPVSDSLRFLWLGKVSSDYMTVILLVNELDNQKIKNSLIHYNFASYVNTANDVSTIFTKYKKIMTRVC
ncbi:MAG: MMPL family transporter [Legionellales bacterium]|nr:MMPL family transporter [Legionellales bacterium]